MSAIVTPAAASTAIISTAANFPAVGIAVFELVAGDVTVDSFDALTSEADFTDTVELLDDPVSDDVSSDAAFEAEEDTADEDDAAVDEAADAADRVELTDDTAFDDAELADLLLAALDVTEGIRLVVFLDDVTDAVVSSSSSESTLSVVVMMTGRRELT